MIPVRDPARECTVVVFRQLCDLRFDMLCFAAFSKVFRPVLCGVLQADVGLEYLQVRAPVSGGLTEQSSK